MQDKIEKPLTFSAGLIEIIGPSKQDFELKKLIENVDTLLYKAKAGGGNRIEISRSSNIINKAK